MEQDAPGSADDEKEPILALLAEVEKESDEINYFGRAISARIEEDGVDLDEKDNVGVTISVLLMEAA